LRSFGLGLQGGDEGAVFAFHSDEVGHDGADAELMDVATEDAGEKGSGDFGEDFFAEVTVDEAGYRFVGVGRVGAEFVGAS